MYIQEIPNWESLENDTPIDHFSFDNENNVYFIKKFDLHCRYLLGCWSKQGLITKELASDQPMRNFDANSDFILYETYQPCNKNFVDRFHLIFNKKEHNIYDLISLSERFSDDYRFDSIVHLSSINRQGIFVGYGIIWGKHHPFIAYPSIE